MYQPRRPHRQDRYDAVIVGARAAGAATGLLLARAGRRVLIVDRSPYGADTLSTHALMRAGVLQLHRWGLLDRVIAAGTPPVQRTTFAIGTERMALTIEPAHGVDALYAPQRTVLDPILVDAAVAAGADVRFETTVTGLQRDDSGRITGVVGHDARGTPLRAKATITVGADGIGSRVARWVGAPLQRVGTAASAFAFGYWSDVTTDGYEWCCRPSVIAGAIPTNDGQTCVFVGTTPDRFRRQLVGDPAAGYLDLLREAAPEMAERMAVATPPAELRRFPGRTGHLRRAYGPGWALVGDAGYYQDPLTAHGISDALRDAELLANAIIELTGEDGGERAALRGYEATRNRLSQDLFSTADAIASYTWGTDQIMGLLLQLSAAMHDEVEALAALDQPPVPHQPGTHPRTALDPRTVPDPPTVPDQPTALAS